MLTRSSSTQGLGDENGIQFDEPEWQGIERRRRPLADVRKTNLHDMEI
jgi:hypothetical protein